MAALHRKVDEIATLIRPESPVVYLDYPVYANIGDLLIEEGTECFLRDHGLPVVKVRSALNFSAADAAALDPGATIVLQGGGNFGDLYDLHQRFRERVVTQCPDQRIILLPQTMYFSSNERLAECAAVFGRHQDLHVCLRDAGSYDFFRRHFRNPAYLVPDMAHCLWPAYAPHRTVVSRSPTLVFERRDEESRSLPVVGGAATRVDWEDTLRLTDRVMLRALLGLHVNHAQLLPGQEIYGLWRLFRRRLTGRAARLVTRYERVVTNRLHVAILGLLTGRSVAMGDNCYGKLSAYHACWLADMPTVTLLDSTRPFRLATAAE